MINKEEELLQKIFGEKQSLWKGKYQIDWCDLCKVIIMKCPDCNATSCNCAACEKCTADIDEFLKAKNQPRDYMSQEEYKSVDRFFRLRDFIEECLHNGFNELNWKWLYEQGKFSTSDRELFPEIQKLHEELKLWPD